MKRPAFTFAETMIVISMTAILSVSLAFSMRNLRERAAFRDDQTKLVALLQKARSLALSNILVEGNTTLFYRFHLESTGATLYATVDDAGTPTETALESLTFQDNVNTPNDVEIFYFPPDGEICFNVDCTWTEAETSFTLQTADSKYVTEFTVDIYGGFPDVQDTVVPGALEEE